MKYRTRSLSWLVVEGRLLELLAGFFVILFNNLDTPGCGFYTWPRKFILISIHKQPDLDPSGDKH